MALNADGTGTCDRCGIRLEGYGAIYGMVCTDLDTAGTIRHRIYCYANQCRSVVIDGFMGYLAAGTLRCTEDNTVLSVRCISEAMLAVDMHPATGEQRLMQFCYLTGSRDRFLTHVQETR